MYEFPLPTEEEKRKIYLVKNYLNLFFYIVIIEFMIYEIFTISFVNFFSIVNIIFLLPIFIIYLYLRKRFNTLKERLKILKIEKRLRGIIFVFSIFPLFYTASKTSMPNMAFTSTPSWTVAFLTLITMIIFEELYIKLNK